LKTTTTDEPRRARAAAPAPTLRPAPPNVTKTGNQSHPSEESRKAFLLRIHPGLLREIEAWAQAELRSTNGQVEYLLRQAVNQRKRSK
jgi:hypothetical protein